MSSRCPATASSSKNARRCTRRESRKSPRPRLPACRRAEAGDEVLARPSHAGREVDRRSIAEEALDLADVGLRVAHVTGAGGDVVALEAPAEESRDRVRDRE